MCYAEKRWSLSENPVWSKINLWVELKTSYWKMHVLIIGNCTPFGHPRTTNILFIFRVHIYSPTFTTWAGSEGSEASTIQHHPTSLPKGHRNKGPRRTPKVNGKEWRGSCREQCAGHWEQPSYQCVSATDIWAPEDKWSPHFPQVQSCASGPPPQAHTR